MNRILLLEDDQSFGYILKEYLLMNNFSVDWAKSGEEATGLISKNIYDVAILDVMLPGIDGYEFARILSNSNDTMPFIFLSAKSLKIDKLKGFKLGAFDFITKPIDEELLVAKINAMLAISKKESSSSYSIGIYMFYPSEFRLTINTKNIQLTNRESKLLTMLCSSRPGLLSRKQALTEIWGVNDEFSRKSMDVFISHLRKYLSEDPEISINNIHGQGFILKP